LFRDEPIEALEISFEGVLGNLEQLAIHVRVGNEMSVRSLLLAGIPLAAGIQLVFF
jgi:hypothetical protein